jgi:DNA-binding LytR/AlgR family response regulator
MNYKNSRIRYVAIDDNFIDLTAVAEYSKAFSLFENCGLFSNGFEAYEAIGYIKPDLVFLDIEMPGINGIELLRKIRASVPMAVFITSFTEFALDGFELSALDYILKPLTPERFAKTASKIEEFWDMRQKSAAYEVMISQDQLTIKEGYNQIRISQNDIIYLEAMQDYTKVVTQKRSYLTLSPISFFMERLPADRFMRVHRSYAVALHQIRELRQSEIICSGTRIPVGRTYRSQVALIRL